MGRAWLLALGLVLSACARPSMSDLVLARVNEEPITVERLNESFTSTHQGHGVLLAGRGAVREFLQSVIDRLLLIQEARRIGAEEDPEIQGRRAALRAKRAAEGFYGDQVTKKVQVTDAEITAAYARLGEGFTARHILVNTREQAQRALERVRGGEEFGEVAREVSRGATASRGGELGIVRWGGLDPKLENALWALQKAEISEPVETEEGWSLIFVAERTPVDPPKLEAVRARIKTVLAQRQARERSVALLKRLMRESDSTVDAEPVVAALTAPKGQAPPATAVVARAADSPVTLEAALKLVNAEAAKTLPPDRLRRQVRWLLEAEVFRILLEKEGLARGYGDRPEVVRALDKVTDEAALEYLLGKVVLAKVEIGAGDAEAYYRSHAKEFTEPEALKLSAILVETEDDAKLIMSALAGGKDFRALARTASKDPMLVASSGEVAGLVTRGKLDPAVEEVAFSLKEGALGSAQGKAGYFVVRLDQRRPERLRPFDEVKEQARQAALRQRSTEAVKEWVGKLRTLSSIDIDDAAIDRAITSYEDSAREKELARERTEKKAGRH